MWRIFCRILSVPQDTAMGLYNVVALPCYGLYYDLISLPWVVVVFYQSTYFTSPTAKRIGLCQWILQALNYVFWGPQISWSLWHVFFGVNQSGFRMNSTTNKFFYKALGWLHDAWCRQPLSAYYYSKLCSALTFYSRIKILNNKSSISYWDIIEHK